MTLIVKDTLAATQQIHINNAFAIILNRDQNCSENVPEINTLLTFAFSTQTAGMVANLFANNGQIYTSALSNTNTFVISNSTLASTSLLLPSLTI
jgi:flagellar biosynthesis GTPase FlhF